MAQIGFTSGKFAFAGKFTFPSKRRASQTPTWLQDAAAILMLIALGEPAAALPQIGPTSSASVHISLSVSAKYGLKANAAEIRALGDEAAGFCMTTNGPPTGLPVHLVGHTADESAAGRMSKEMAVQLHWCTVGGWTIDSIDRGDHGEEAALLIVRPE